MSRPETPPPDAGRPVVVLIGFMGAGKSQVGRRVADRLGVPFTDSDAVIEAEQHRSIRQIFAQDGEAAFRELEHATVARLLHRPSGVLALGGGAAVHPDTQELLREHPCVVHLTVGLDRARERVGADPGRPMLTRPDLAEIHRARLALYGALTPHQVDTDELAVEHVCHAVLALAAGPRPGPPTR